jgi:hypothetical protein
LNRELTVPHTVVLPIELHPPYIGLYRYKYKYIYIFIYMFIYGQHDLNLYGNYHSVLSET